MNTQLAEGLSQQSSNKLAVPTEMKRTASTKTDELKAEQTYEI